MISAVLLAAGQSRRMGRPKMSLTWGATTVLGHVIDVFHSAGVEDVLAVSGGDRTVVEEIAANAGARTAFNPGYAEQDMLGSIQVGLRALPPQTEAAFIALGDQPQILEATVRTLLNACQRPSPPLIVPSYEMRRGHPWLISRLLWDALLRLQAPQTPRDFLQAHADRILHVAVDTPTILADLDTPNDYLKSQR